jgi:PAS domain S-box-containing protein
MSIRLKLIIMFLAIATVPLLLVSDLTFTNYKHSLEANRLSQLQDLAIFRADRIDAYFARAKAHMKITQGLYNVKKNLPVMTRLSGDPNNPEFLATRKMLNDQLQEMQSVSELSDIMLVTPEGRVVYANKPGHYLKDLSNGSDTEQMAFAQGKDRTYFSDVYFDKVEDNRFEMLLTAPAYNFDNVFIGVIAFEIDMTPAYKFIQDTTGLGKTGEILIGKKTGNQLIYLNPLRHDPNAVLNRRIDIGGDIAWPMQQAVQGKTAEGQYLDYRGKEVIAAWQYIPSLDWGLVAKIDTDEAFADVANLRKLSVIILGIVIVLSGITAFSIAQSISEPIKKLSEGAEIIGSGNLDYKIGLNLKDEIGQLSRSFDKMTSDLKHTTASRDELNREIEERKHVEAALRESEERFRTMANAMQQLAWIARADGYIIWYNKRWYDYTGTTAEQMEGWGWQSVHDPALLPKIMEQWKTSIAQGTLFEMEFPLRGADGRFRQFLTRGVPIKDTQGRVVQWFGTNTDVNDIKEVEEKLRRNMEELARFNQLMVGREIRMIELKKEVNELCDKTGQQQRYNLDFDKEQP